MGCYSCCYGGFRSSRLERGALDDAHYKRRETVVARSGFALDNFDGIGAWRDLSEAGAPIDSAVVLANGSKVDGPTALRNDLLARPQVFVGTMTEKMLTYALGRGVEYYDMPAIRKIVRNSAAHDYRFSTLVMGIVQSTPFQMRRSEQATP